MSFQERLQNAPAKLSRLDEFNVWLSKLDQVEQDAAFTLLREYSGRYCAEVFSKEGFKCGEKLIWAWKQADRVTR